MKVKLAIAVALLPILAAAWSCDRATTAPAGALALQGWLPAQSIYVVSPPGKHVWFDLDPSRPIGLPAWGKFDWSNLRRFD